MASLVCAMCRDTLQTKPALSTTCGHIFCSSCATDRFTSSPTCPVCHTGWVQTFKRAANPLVPRVWHNISRCFQGYHRQPRRPATPDAIPPMPQPPPYQNPQQYELEPSPPHITPSVSSLRISIDATGKRFPWTQAGVVPACDLDGCPVFLGVAAFKDGVHPCKIRVTPEGRPDPKVPYEGSEHDHSGTTLLLPFNPATMEWVQASHGTIPPERRPIEGGYGRMPENKYYHALALVEGVRVPGKVAENGHWGGAKVPFDGREHTVSTYELLSAFLGSRGFLEF